MTKRRCPWCGRDSLVLVNVSGSNPELHHSSFLYWEDRDCGYREKTSADQYYDYEKGGFVECERVVISFHKPRSPLPESMMPEYLRRSGSIVETPAGQLTLGGS